MRSILGILVFVLAFTSCGIMRRGTASGFVSISDARELNGHYLNRAVGKEILSCFNIRDYADFVTLTSESPNEIKLTYYNDSTTQERVFKGKMKKSYFEIYFSKMRFFIPLIFSTVDVDRVRIGKTEDGKLAIRKLVENWGNLLVFAAGYSYEDGYAFPHSSDYKYYMPTRENNLWGYSDSLGNMIISPKYDFATIFENDVARVRLNEKWGLINKQGVEVIQLIYDEILPFKTIPPTFIVSVFEKKGMFDMNGNELIPIIYDDMASYLSPQGLVHVRLKNEWRYVSPYK